MFQWFKQMLATANSLTMSEGESLKKNKVGGLIKYFELEDFWLNALTEEQRNEVKQRWAKGLGTEASDVDEGDVKVTYRNHIQDPYRMKRPTFLMVMAQGISDVKLKEFLINWAIKEAEELNDIIRLHYIYMDAWKEYKQLVKIDKSYYEHLIEVLKKDCAIHDKFNEEYYKQNEIIPRYPAFKELALAYERLGMIEEAIKVSKLALEKNVSEETSFERRITRLEKKLNKEGVQK